MFELSLMEMLIDVVCAMVVFGVVVILPRVITEEPNDWEF